ncbi:MAG: class I tRNA ligase family protein, partial [Desulfuromonadales bacterium]|nr:class I tRNA ligase family protein [Desulfuromonadales bacterium]
DDPEIRKRARSVLFVVLERLLRLLHPFMPFITEEIWQALPGQRCSEYIMQAEFPKSDLPVDAAGAGQMDLVMDAIRAIRNIRGEMDVAPSKKVDALLECKSEASLATLKNGEGYIRSLARTSDLQMGTGLDKPEQAATQVVGDVEIFLPLAGLVDIDEEEKRLDKEIAKVKKDVDFFTKKLANEKFVANAPAQVLEKDRGKLRDAEEKLAILKQSLEKILELK